MNSPLNPMRPIRPAFLTRLFGISAAVLVALSCVHISYTAMTARIAATLEQSQ